MTDCLLIGFNDTNFEDYVKMLKSMGTDSGAYRDLNLAYVNFNNKPCRSIDILNHFYFEDKPDRGKPFHNSDFLWPVITYLGTYLNRRGFSFDYVNLPHLEKERLKEKLSNKDLLTIAITTTLYVSPQPILELMAFIKQYNETAKIIIGGPYISNQAKMADELSLQQLFHFIGADIYVISQEGELALVNVLRALKNNSSLDPVDNIAYHDGKRFVFTTRSIESNSLEENMVDYSLFSKEEIDQFVTLRTAKSCPFSCAFCGFPQRAGKYTYIDVSLVEQELNSIADLNTVTTLSFIDDTFNVPKARFKEILRMMINNRYGFKWNSYLRSDHADEEAIGLMKEAGCEGVFLGVESGSDTILEKMNKSSRRKDYLRVIPLLREAGISQYASIIVGFPGETYETVHDTIGFIEEARPDFFRAQLWYCDPTTPIWGEREKYGVKGSAFNWSHDTMDVNMACDLIDKIFLSVKNSTWLPQNGFEQWSTFYLQRKGMRLDQIKRFLSRFNASVKEKLIYPDKQEIAPELVEGMRVSSRFDEVDRSAIRPVEILTASEYLAAEDFWTNEFAKGATPSRPRNLASPDEQANAKWSFSPLQIGGPTIDALKAAFGADFSKAILAAYSILLSRINGGEETVIVSAFGDKESSPAPLKLFPHWDTTVSDFVSQVREKHEQAMRHQKYAFHIVTNPLRMAEGGGACPPLDAGFLSCNLLERQQETRFEDLFNYNRSAIQNMSIILELHNRDSDLNMRLSYLDRSFNHDAIAKLSSYFASILESIGAAPGMLIGEILRDNFYKESDALVQADAKSVFSF